MFCNSRGNIFSGDDHEGGFDEPGRKRGKKGSGSRPQKGTQQKRGSVRKGGIKKGRAAPRSKPKKKRH